MKSALAPVGSEGKRNVTQSGKNVDFTIRNTSESGECHSGNNQESLNELI